MMMNNKRLNSERLVLKRQKETVYYRNIRLKRRKQDPRSQRLPLSPKKEKIQDSRNLVEIDAQTRRRDANKTRARVQRHPTLSFLSTKSVVFIRNAIQKTTSILLCVLFARPNFSRRKTKRNDSQITHIRALLFERKRDSSSLSLSLSLRTKAHRTRSASHKAQKKRSQYIPLTRLNLLRIYMTRNQNFAQREREGRQTLNKKKRPINLRTFPSHS